MIYSYNVPFKSFSLSQERRTQSKHTRARSRQTNLLLRRSNMGWLKPHATISTQTENKENTQKPSAKKSVKKLDRNSLTENKCKQRFVCCDL